MHLQLRTKAQLSPPDLDAFLGVLESAGINLLAAGGSDVEQGGEFAFAVEDGSEDRAREVLEAKGYHPRIVEIDLCWITSNTPGQLRRCIAEVREKNLATGRTIKDITLGVPDSGGHIPVQVYSEPAS
jgi:hypothetical protein